MAKKKMVRLTQVRSLISRPGDQKSTMESLGLGKMNRTVEKEVNPQIMGMVNKVKHLITIEEL